MENKDIIKLEDDKKYIVLDIIDIYFYLVNYENANDFCIRKLATKEDPIIIQLDDEKEFQKAISLLSQKYPISSI